jgi:hypothetical protein
MGSLYQFKITVIQYRDACRLHDISSNDHLQHPITALQTKTTTYHQSPSLSVTTQVIVDASRVDTRREISLRMALLSSTASLVASKALAFQPAYCSLTVAKGPFPAKELLVTMSRF